MVRNLIRNQAPGNRLWVRIPCPPLLFYPRIRWKPQRIPGFSGVGEDYGHPFHPLDFTSVHLDFEDSRKGTVSRPRSIHVLGVVDFVLRLSIWRSASGNSPKLDLRDKERQRMCRFCCSACLRGVLSLQLASD
jgi:hypothetical protein